MKSNQALRFGIEDYGIVDKCCLADTQRFNYGFNLFGGIEPIVFAVSVLFATCSFSLATPLCLIFILFFHFSNYILNFVKAYRVEGEVVSPPSLRILKVVYRFSFLIETATFIFQILNVISTSIFKIFGRFFPTPFQAFQIPLCNPSLIALQR